jgi:hypothetical protein
MPDVELRFVSPVLRDLDTLESEVLACTVWRDVRPCNGVAGLCDWRLGGRISKLQRQGYLQGEPREVMLVPGRPRMSFEKLLLFGAGSRDAFDETVFADVVQHMLSVIDGLHAHQVVVELPGRQAGLVAADRSADMLLEAAGRGREQSVWIEERRRVRREL